MKVVLGPDGSSCLYECFANPQGCLIIPKGVLLTLNTGKTWTFLLAFLWQVSLSDFLLLMSSPIQINWFFSVGHDPFPRHQSASNGTTKCFKAECNCFVTYLLLGMLGFVVFWSLLMLRIYLPEEYWKWSYIWSWLCAHQVVVIHVCQIKSRKCQILKAYAICELPFMSHDNVVDKEKIIQATRFCDCVYKLPFAAKKNCLTSESQVTISLSQKRTLIIM